MARTAGKVEDLVSEDPEMRAALETVLERSENGTVEWADVSDDLTSGQWGRLIEKGVLEDADGSGFHVPDSGEVREGLESDDEPVPEVEGDSSWSKWDKLAALGALAMFAGYSLQEVRAVVGQILDVALGPLNAVLPFYIVILVLSLFTGLYSTLLQANLMDMDKMSQYQERMKEIQERRKEAKERGDDEELDRIQEEQMEAMGDNLGMFKEQFRPMVWIMLFTIPVFLWMYWKILDGHITAGEMEIVLPMAGAVEWRDGIVGPMEAWIVWYFLCSMGFTQIIRKALNIQTTPT